MVKKARKSRSDKGKKRPSYPKKRKKPRPYKVKAHSRGGPGPLALGSFFGKGTLAGDEDPKDPWRVGSDPWKVKRRKTK